MMPVRSLKFKSRVVRFVRLPSSAGMESLSPLPPRLRVVRFVRLPSSAGMALVSPLPLRLRVVRFVRLPSSAGMESLSLLASRLRVVRFARLPSSAGMVPVMPMFAAVSEAESESSCKAGSRRAETLLAEMVIPVHASILGVVGEPQVRSGCSTGRSLFAATAAQWFWTATKASQSSARSLFAPAAWGLEAMSTKVPSEHPVEDKAGIVSVERVPLYWQPTGEYDRSETEPNPPNLTPERSASGTDPVR